MMSLKQGKWYIQQYQPCLVQLNDGYHINITVGSIGEFIFLISIQIVPVASYKLLRALIN